MEMTWQHAVTMVVVMAVVGAASAEVGLFTCCIQQSAAASVDDAFEYLNIGRSPHFV